MFRSGVIILIISDEEVSHIMKIIKSPWESGSLIKGLAKYLNVKQKNKKGRFLRMLLDILGTNL